MTRIVAGSAKGRNLAVPKQGTRPTSSKVREAIFSKLAAWGLTEGVNVLDLFAGSGALGLEAFSRGASSVELVENARAAQLTVQGNIAELDAGSRVRLHRTSAEKFLLETGRHYDVVFVDPPYTWTNDQLSSLLDIVAQSLTHDGIVVVERDNRTGTLNPGGRLLVEEERRWGDTAVYFLGLPAQSESEVWPSK